jgi:cyanophycinase
MRPKGTIVIIGGAEDTQDGKNDIEGKNKEFEKLEILKSLVPHKGGKSRIEIITTATDLPKEMRSRYRSAFKKLRFSEVGFLDIEDKDTARRIDLCQRVKAAHAVFFGGGDQFLLSTILGGTHIIKAIKYKYLHDKDFIVAGTSAGAMAMSKIMIYEGGMCEAILKDDLKVTSGLGLMDTPIIDTHFIKRGRFSRLAHAVIMNPGSLGIGLGEDTALIIKKGIDAECHGSGMVVIIDGDELKMSNIAEVEDGLPIYAENLKVHLLVKESRFNLSERNMWVPLKKRRKPKK